MDRVSNRALVVAVAIAVAAISSCSSSPSQPVTALKPCREWPGGYCRYQKENAATRSPDYIPGPSRDL
jgi:hypothetical protein